jgi:hypothetical protein
VPSRGRCAPPSRSSARTPANAPRSRGAAGDREDQRFGHELRDNARRPRRAPRARRSRRARAVPRASIRFVTFTAASTSRSAVAANRISRIGRDRHRRRQQRRHAVGRFTSMSDISGRATPWPASSPVAAPRGSFGLQPQIPVVAMADVSGM